MAVDPAFIDEVRRLEAEMPESNEPLAFESLAEVFAFTIARVRSDGSMAEDDAVEALAKAANLSQAELREIMRVLAPLGYTQACDRLKAIGRHAPRPKPAMTFNWRWKRRS
jgi:hypothetical protein